MSESSEPEETWDDLFQEPKDYFKPDKEPTQVEHKTLNGTVLKLHLVGQNPLWVSARSFLIEKESKSPFISCLSVTNCEANASSSCRNDWLELFNQLLDNIAGLCVNTAS
jgi:hypothetical protein